MPDFMVRGGTTYRLVTDHVGSVRLVVDADTGAVAQRIDYDAWGHVLADSNPGFQPFGFAGGLYDPQTGLVRFGARDYDPSLGRWLSKDPILFNGDGQNLYEYSRNDPVNRHDPAGTRSVFECFAAMEALWDEYQDMKHANTINADCYFHCVGHCEAARYGECGKIVSWAIGWGREIFTTDSPAECAIDLQCNEFGRNANPNLTCQEACSPLVPNGLSDEYY